MKPPEEAAMTIESAVAIISQWDSTAVRKDFVFDGYRLEIDQYLVAVDTIQRTSELTTITDDKRKSTVRLAMLRLADEFRNILVHHKNSREQLSPGSETWSSSMTDSISNYDSNEDEFRYADGTSCEAMDDLRRIAERMNDAGYLNECIQVYQSVRKSYMIATLQRLNFQNLSVLSVRRLEWKVLEKLIKEWIRAVKIYVGVLFMNEKRFIEVVFGGLGTENYKASYAEIVKDTAHQLFDFADSISFVTASYEKLFRVLDVYEVLSNLLPQLNHLFRSETLNPICIQVAQTLPKLADAIRIVLLNFENAVIRGKSKLVPEVVSIHHSTRYVMTYISKMCDYEQTLSDLIISMPSEKLSNQTMEFIEFEGQTPLSIHLNWIVTHLLFILEGKSKLYKDASMGCLFTMNNVHFIVQKIKRQPQLKEMIVHYYHNMLTVEFDRARAKYLKLTSDKLSYCLREEGLKVIGVFSLRVLKDILRQRLKGFNLVFHELLKTLAYLVELDVHCWMNLRTTILDNLIRAYSSFLDRFRSHVETYLKYSPKDIENKVLSLTPRHPE